MIKQALTALMTLSLLTPERLPMAKQIKNQPTDFDFIYVHGFGEGGKSKIPFESSMNEFIRKKGINSKVNTFSYSDEKLDFLNIFDQWESNVKTAESSGSKLYRDVILKYEDKKKPYYLVGYSLGTRTIAKGLQQSNRKLKYLRGIYFIGSALEHDTNVETKMLPDGMKINNYFSPGFDCVLKISFRVAQGKNAGGEVGFDDTKLFNNYRTSCTHARKGGLLTRDYSDMAPAIAYLAMQNERIFLKEDSSYYNLEMNVASGVLHWNNISKTGKILIQQNTNTGHYRAVSIDSDGSRKRLAWGMNLHSVLKELQLFPAPYKKLILPVKAN